jgi:hypothetical protein
MNYIGEKPSDPLSFEIYPDEKGQAATTLYEDDGSSPAYKQGAFRRTNVRVAPQAGRGWRINLDAPAGSYQPVPRSFIFNIKTAAPARIATLDGRPLAALQSGAKGNGWRKDASGITMRIVDDGKAHEIEIR